MSSETPASEIDLPDISAVDAISIPVGTAPFGYLLGRLFTVHLVGDETSAVWLTTVALSSLGMLSWAVWQS